MRHLIAFIFWICIILIIAYNCSSDKGPIGEYQRQTDIMKSYVGEKIVIDKDTLTITDYSVFKDTYTLSNGVSINKEMVKILK